MSDRIYEDYTDAEIETMERQYTEDVGTCVDCDTWVAGQCLCLGWCINRPALDRLANAQRKTAPC